MIKFKKFLAAAMTGMMMLGAVGVSAPAVTVKAEETKPAITAEVKYEDFRLDVTTEKISYFTLEVLKDNTGSKVSASYTYKAEGPKTSVDLSFLKISKEAYIRVYNTLKPEEKSVVITINAQPGKLSMKFVDGQDTFAKSFVAKVGKTDLTLDDKGVEKLEFRPLYAANWGKFTSAADAFARLTSSRIAGTTWVVRQAAVTTTGSAVAGTEIKVKIPAIAKAPKVSVDYTKGSVKLPKGSEYFVINASGTAILKDSKDKVAVSAAVATTPEKLLKDLGVASSSALTMMKEGFTLVVNTAKTDKKAASQQAFLNIPAVAVAEASGSAVSVGSNKVTAESLGAGLKLTAAGANFEYSLDGTKWAKVAKDKSVVAKITDNTKEVQVRQAGVKPAKDGTGAALPSLTAKLTYTKPVAGITITDTKGAEIKAPIEVATSSAISLASHIAVTVTDKDGKAVSNPTLEYSVTGGSADAKIENAVLNIEKEAVGTTLTVTVKVTKGDAKDKTATVQFKVKAK